MTSPQITMTPAIETAGGDERKRRPQPREIRPFIRESELGFRAPSAHHPHPRISRSRERSRRWRVAHSPLAVRSDRARQGALRGSRGRRQVVRRRGTRPGATNPRAAYLTAASPSTPPDASGPPRSDHVAELPLSSATKRGRRRDEPLHRLGSQPSGAGMRLAGEDLSREVRHRTHDESVAVAHGEDAPTIAFVRMDELGVPARRAEGHGGVVVAGRIDERTHPWTVSRLGEPAHRPKVNADVAKDLDGGPGAGRERHGPPPQDE